MNVTPVTVGRINPLPENRAKLCLLARFSFSFDFC
jgi:hypothetical protein